MSVVTSGCGMASPMPPKARNIGLGMRGNTPVMPNSRATLPSTASVRITMSMSL